MVDGGVRPRKTFGRKIKDHQTAIENLYNLIDSQNVVSQSAIGSGIGTGSPTSNSSRYLPIKGGKMEGVVGYDAQAISISGGNLKLNESAAGDRLTVNKIIFVAPQSGTTDDLDTIEGRIYDGQEHTLVGVSGNTITIKHGNTGAEDNDERAIYCPGGMDYSLDGDASVSIFFDPVVNGWRLISGAAGGGTGISWPIRPGNDTIATVTGTVTVDLNQGSESHVFPIGPITGDVDITFSNPPSSGSTQVFILEITQDGTGLHDVTFNDTINGTTPTVDTSASTKTLLACTTLDGGTTYWVFRTGNSAIFAADTYATKALDNLVSPVLNASINFNSNAPTNFNGYVSQIVGNTLVNDASGATWTLPSGDAYLYNINGIEEFEVSSTSINVKGNAVSEYIGWTADVGQTAVVSGTGLSYTMPTGDIYDWFINGIQEFAISSVGIAVKNSITLANTSADPATNGEIQLNGTDIKVYSGGSVRNLSTFGGPPFDDNQVIIQDELDNTKTLTFTLSSLNTGVTRLFNFLSSSTNRTYSFPDLTGTVALSTVSQTFSATQTFQNIDFDGNGTRDIGTVTTYANDIFTENLTFRGSGDAILSTRAMIAADASNMIFNAPAADDFIWQVAAVTKMQFNTTGASDDIRIRAGASRVLGFITDSSATTLGTSGTIKIPVDGGSVGTAAAADTDFGDDVGCIGLYLNTIGSGNPTFCIKIDDGTGVDNRWAAIIINRTTGALSGSILT